MINYIIEYLQWFFIPIDPDTFDPTQTAWLPVAVAIASLAAQGYGMYKKNQASKKLQAEQEAVNAKYKSLADWYNAESSKDFLDTEQAQSALGNIREQYKKALETSNNNMAKGGATAEAKVAAQGELQGKYNDVIRQLVGYGTNYKQNMKRDYQGVLNGLYNNNAGTYMPAVQSWQNFLGNAQGVTSAAVQAGNWGGNQIPGNDPSNWMNKTNATWS